jgi:hypothetical protein
MANFRINVKIEGGKSLLGFYCLLYKNGNLVEEYKSEYGFEKVFDNLDGVYMLSVFGTNPVAANKKTTIKAYFEDIELRSNISSSIISIQKGNRVTATYYFKTAS